MRRGPEEGGSSPGNTVHANRVTARLRWGGILKAVGGLAPPATPWGREGVWGPSCAAAVATSPPRRERPSENKTGSRPSLAHQHKPKTPSGKG